MTTFPTVVRFAAPSGETRYSLGHRFVDLYLEFVAGRVRPNTLRAVAFDLKTFFSVVVKDPLDVVAADMFEFLAEQRGDRKVIRLLDGESGMSARTIARRLSSVSGLYSYLIARGDTPVASNPVPRGLATRRQGGRSQRVPLVRVQRTLPKILSPKEVDALLAAMRTHRDRAMVLAMVCEEHQVSQAQAAGWTWAQIAAALDVSPQAAHQRHAGKVATSSTQW